MNFLIFKVCFLLLGLNYLKANRPVCQSNYDPFISTFDGLSFGFQYSGDHYILYDDFKDTRVTVGYQTCFGSASCNCAVYVKKGTKLIFVDFCGVTNNISPTSQLYGVSVEKNLVGLNALKHVPQCTILAAANENNEQAWRSIPTFLGKFQCARLQGGSYFTTYVIRTVEQHFSNSIKVKFDLRTRDMPRVSVDIPETSFGNTGGLCGRFDRDRTKELYVLDKDGVEKFLTTTSSDLNTLRSFWNLNSIYNKNSFVQKRCPECFLMSERSFYCPCDNFNLFENRNYNLNPSDRPSYCRVPMSSCVERWSNFINNTVQPITTTTTRPSNYTTRPPVTISPGVANQTCWSMFLNNQFLANAIQSGCLDVLTTIEMCVLDVQAAGTNSVINIHIQASIDITIQSILNNQPNCQNLSLIVSCPNNCSGNGVCNLNQQCLTQNGVLSEQCLTPAQCVCNHNFGGIDCSQDLSDFPNFDLDLSCCDLRTSSCNLVNVFGFPFSSRDRVVAHVELIENRVTGLHTFNEYTNARFVSQNNLQVRLNNIAQLTLYKNIHNIANNHTLVDSTTLARISLAYANNTFVKRATFRLYDSRCRTCHNGLTNQLNDKCEINGVCYNVNQTSSSYNLFYCNPNLNNTEWSIRPTPDPLCNGQNSWTEWFNSDSPEGDGDLELFTLRPYGCLRPVLTQVQTLNGVPYNRTGQVVHFNQCFGFMCLNSENNNTCLDYKYRHCCPSNSIFTTTTRTTTTRTTTTTTRTTPTTPTLLDLTTNFETEEEYQDESTLSQTATTSWLHETEGEHTSVDELESSTTLAQETEEEYQDESTLSQTATTSWLHETEEVDTSVNELESSTALAHETEEEYQDESTLSQTATTSWLHETEEVDTSVNELESSTTLAQETEEEYHQESTFVQTDLSESESTSTLAHETEEEYQDESTLSQTTSSILSSSTTTRSTTTLVPCQFTLNSNNRSNELFNVLQEGRALNFIRFELKPNRRECQLENEFYLTFSLRTFQFTAQEGLDYLPLETSITLDQNRSWFDLPVTVLDDNVIEPFEFFVLQAYDLQTSLNNLQQSEPINFVVYIEDNDYETGQKDSTIFDIFDFNLASTETNVVYYPIDSNQSYSIRDPQLIFPRQGGISLNFKQVKVMFEFIGYDVYILHTLEVNNPEVCNLKNLFMRRSSFAGHWVDSFEMRSLLLNDRPVVDVDYYKSFYGLGSEGDVLDYMRVLLLQNKDNENIRNCEFRAFGEINQDKKRN